MNDVELRHWLAEFVVEVCKKTSKENVCFLLMCDNICVKYQSFKVQEEFNIEERAK